MGQENLTTIEYVSKDGTKFTIRSIATRRDQSQMNISMSEGSYGTDGTKITTSPLKLFPWLFERFVVGWSGGPQKEGRQILDAVYSQPADPDEDMVLVVGAYVFNHVEGLVPKESGTEQKKD